MRASIAAEAAGIRSVSIVASGFVPQARAVAASLGLARPAIAQYPGVIMTEPPAVLREKVRTLLVPQVLDGFAAEGSLVGQVPAEPDAAEIVFRGTLDDVLDHFHTQLWTDGLPIVPPTPARVQRFLRHAGRPAEEVIAVLPPAQREATVHNIAVNGVMAGCRPEYMPILIAIGEAIATPVFRLEDAGSTPGWEPLVILSGPVVRDLEFNAGAGVLRVGRQANASVGRFLRLIMRNLAGLLIPPGVTDKAAIGATFHVALAEDEDAVTAIGWQPFGVEQGFAPGESVVTVQSVLSASLPIYSAGDHAPNHLDTIAEVWGHTDCARRLSAWAVHSTSSPLLVLSPSIAGVIARDGWSKDDVRRYLHETVRIPTSLVEHYAEMTSSLRLRERQLADVYTASIDADGTVPVFLEPERLGIVVAGDPDRNQSRGYLNNHEQGVRVSRRVQMPQV